MILVVPHDRHTVRLRSERQISQRIHRQKGFSDDPLRIPNELSWKVLNKVRTAWEIDITEGG